MRIGLLTDGGYPYATGESRLWCDRLVRGLAPHEFHIYALSRSARQERGGWVLLPPHVPAERVRTAPLWAPADDGRGHGRRDRRRFALHFARLAEAICAEGGPAGADGAAGAGGSAGGDGAVGGPAGPDGAAAFAEGLYGLADLGRERGGLYAALRSETAVRLLESACRAPGARRSVQSATVPDFLAFADQLERALRPLSLDWYGEADGLGAVDLCHAASGGSAALPGLLAKRFFGVPLLVTEYGVRLRAHYLATAGAPGTGAPGADAVSAAPVRALLASFHRRLAAEIYRQAGVITPGNLHARRWQERCGADRAKLRTVYPGMETERFAAFADEGAAGSRAGGAGVVEGGADGAGTYGAGGDRAGADGAGLHEDGPATLVWVGRIEPAKDLISLLHAFAEIRRAQPDTRLRIVSAPVRDTEGAAYLAHCRGLAAQLFPDEAADAHAVGDNPVSFEEIGGPDAPDLPEVYGSGTLVLLSSVVEGFPISLVEAMFCARATVSTDVGAVVEVIGGTGLVVPPRNPRALADACVTLLRDPGCRARLGAAARARALELFTVEQNLAAFRALYLELISHAPVRRAAESVDADGAPLPFAHPAETHVPGHWTAARRPPRTVTSWADPGRRVGAYAGAGDHDA
ncbi:glycosyltransferase [Streptomyces sp. NPDC059134]|uniref:glycosyltransferase n=1 Tax=Streptomyces sp. NPDC059134 TaxID=3346738 RepID=UPI00367ED578